MGYLAFRSSKENIDLVTEEYYKQELVYESHLVKMRNAQALSQPVQVRVNGQGVEVQFPQLEAQVKGQLQIFRPSDAQYDRLVTLLPDAQGRQMLDVKGMPAGLYRLKIDWQAGNTSYYTEQAIHLQ